MADGSESRPPISQLHLDYDNTLTHEVRRDFKHTAKNTLRVWRNASATHAETSRGVEKLRKTVGTFIVDIGIFKTIRPEALKLVSQIKTLVPTIKINSSREDRQLDLTREFMQHKGLLGTKDEPLITDIAFRSPGLSPEESKRQYIEKSFHELDQAGLSQSQVAVVDDNLSHIRAMAELDPSRVLAYWVAWNKKEKELTVLKETLPENVVPVGNLEQVYQDLSQRVTINNPK